MQKTVYTELQQTTAGRLAELMRKSPLTGKRTTNKTLAEHLGVKQQSVSSWTTGATTPDTKHIAPIAKYFGVSCDYLLCASEVKTPDVDVQAVVSRYGLSETSLSYLERLNTPTDIDAAFSEIFFTDGKLKIQPRTEAERQSFIDNYEYYKALNDYNSRRIDALNLLLKLSPEYPFDASEMNREYATDFLLHFHRACYETNVPTEFILADETGNRTVTVKPEVRLEMELAHMFASLKEMCHAARKAFFPLPPKP